ncbi:MAG: dephospho-CoA kinase [Bacillaceae bacterium G1]|nr:dephospho-CoA kinase [Bacillota bacterium]OJF17269.1 MAG: dephospho-CoA kinase [Bacillaceae bacterium G1]
MRVIFGITGGIATGKSTVSAMLRKRGAVIVDADYWAREVVKPGSEGWAAIRQAFGEEYFHPDGTLNREKLASLVFSDEEARQRLNAITHPLIRQKMDEQVQAALAADPEAVVVLDIPLLIESMVQEGQRRVDKLILVYVPPSIQLERLMHRNGLSREEAEKRIRAQMPIDEKRQYADFIIDNSGSLAETEEQVERLMGQLRTLVHHARGQK